MKRRKEKSSDATPEWELLPLLMFLKQLMKHWQLIQDKWMHLLFRAAGSMISAIEEDGEAL